MVATAMRLLPSYVVGASRPWMYKTNPSDVHLFVKTYDFTNDHFRWVMLHSMPVMSRWI